MSPLPSSSLTRSDMCLCLCARGISLMICPFRGTPQTMAHVYARNALRSQHQHLDAVRRSQPCARRLFVNSMICKIDWQMNNRRILAFISCIFNDGITRHDGAKHGSYLKTPKVRKFIFPKWRLLTGLDMNVDCDSKDLVYDPVNDLYRLAWYDQTTEYDKWIDELQDLHDYSEHTTVVST